MSSILVIGANCTFGSELIECLSQEYDSLILTETQERISDLYQNMEKYGETLKFKICELNVECVSDIEKLVINLEKEGYLISSLVYCAGINIIENSLEITEEQWDKLISINLKGFFFCSKEVIAHMIRNGISGRIVAIGSQHSVVVSRERAAYCASKGGMVQLARELALEFSELGILVNIVSPTFIISSRNEHMLNTARFKKEYLRKIPLKKYATAKDVIKAILFLINNDNCLITGQNILVDGGYTIA